MLRTLCYKNKAQWKMSDAEGERRKKKTHGEMNIPFCNWFFAWFTFHLLQNNKQLYHFLSLFSVQWRKDILCILFFFFSVTFCSLFFSHPGGFFICPYEMKVVRVNKNMFSFRINCYCVCVCKCKYMCMYACGSLPSSVSLFLCVDGWMRMWMCVQTSEWWEW